MLTTTRFTTLKDALSDYLASSDPTVSRDDFLEMSLQEQVGILSQVASGAGLDAVTTAEFEACALVLQLKAGTLQPGMEDHLRFRDALQPEGAPPVGTWHKANPPTSVWDFAPDPSLSTPSPWAPDIERTPLIARKLSFTEARYPLQIAFAVLNEFGIGGVEDFRDPRSLAWLGNDGHFEDPTMELFVTSVSRYLPATQPAWFDETGQLFDELPEGVDGRSAVEIEQEREAALQAKRAEEQRLRREAQKEERIKAYHVEKVEVLGWLGRLQDQQGPAVVAALSLDELWERQKSARADKGSWLPPEAKPMVDALAQQLFSQSDVGTVPTADELAKKGMDEAQAQQAVDAAEKEVEKITERCARRATNFVEQYCQVPLERANPERFRTTEWGDLRVRKTPSTTTPSGAVSRTQRVIHTRLSKLLDKYGTAEVVRGVAAFFGRPELVDELLRSAPADSEAQAGVPAGAEAPEPPDSTDMQDQQAPPPPPPQAPDQAAPAVPGQAAPEVSDQAAPPAPPPPPPASGGSSLI